MDVPLIYLSKSKIHFTQSNIKKPKVKSTLQNVVNQTVNFCSRGTHLTDSSQIFG